MLVWQSRTGPASAKIVLLGNWSPDKKAAKVCWCQRTAGAEPSLDLSRKFNWLRSSPPDQLRIFTSLFRLHERTPAWEMSSALAKEFALTGLMDHLGTFTLLRSSTTKWQ